MVDAAEAPDTWPSSQRALGLGSADICIAGHEPCGVVVAVGAHVNPRQAWVGQRAMVHHYRGCGACPHCSTGWQQLCVDGVAEVYGVTGARLGLLFGAGGIGSVLAAPVLLSVGQRVRRAVLLPLAMGTYGAAVLATGLVRAYWVAVGRML